MILKLIVGWGELVNPNNERSVLCWGSFLTPTGLYSVDLQDEQVIDGLTITNPFALA
jgi:hypothetical protein